VQQRLQFWLAIFVALSALTLGIYGWHQGWFHFYASAEAFRAWVQRIGPWGPLGIVIAQVLQVLLAPLPGQVVGLAAGYLYGPFWGTVYAAVGLILGTALTLWLSRRLGRPAVESVVRPGLVTRMDRYAAKYGEMAFFLIFLIPFLPDDLCCLAAGLTPLRIRRLLVVATLGRLPGLIFSTWIGAQGKQLQLWQVGLFLLSAALLALILARYRRALQHILFRLLETWLERR